MKLRLVRPPTMFVEREIVQGEHVRLWLSGRCDLVSESTLERRNLGLVHHDPADDEYRVVVLDYELDPRCRHCGEPV